MTAQTLSQQLARFAVDCRKNGVPDEVSRSVCDRVLDVIGLCFGARTLETTEAVVTYVARQGGAPQAHVIGSDTVVPAALAALANGTMAHSLDYDDTHLPSVLHPSASVVPAGLAAAEALGAGGPQFVSAVAAGLEVCVRIGMAGYDEQSRNSVFFEHGQHATSICGAIGSAVTVGLLRGLDTQGITHCIGIAASMAAGIIEANRTGGTVKRLHCGWAGHSALTAAELVELGFTGPPTVFEGRFGFFEAFLRGQADASAISEGLGERWAVPGIFFKPYPANHFTHAVVDAGRTLRERGITPDSIKSVRIGVPASVVRTVGEPLERKRAPTTPYEAQFSAPYALTVGLFGGGGLGAALKDYQPERFTDFARRELMSRAIVEADEECTALFPYQFPSVIRGTTHDGSSFEVKALENRGGPQCPLTTLELRRKFLDNSSGALHPERADQVIAAIDALLDGASVSDLMNLLIHPARARKEGTHHA